VTAAPPAVVVRGLAKRYGGRTVLADVSFEVASGELVALLGPNGAGKTTTVEIVEGYRTRDGGIVTVLGFDPAERPREVRSRLGLMLQEGGIHPRTTAREAVRLHAALYREPADPEALLGLVGLERVSGTPYRRLSGGERQRLGIALALVGRPQVVVLDEPTAGLDAEGRLAIRALVAAVRDAGMAVLLTTHDLVDVERLADRVLLLDGGRIIEAGRPDELAAEGPGAIRFRTLPAIGEPERALLETRLAGDSCSPILVAEPGSGAWRLSGCPPSPAVVARLAVACADLDVLLVEVRTGAGSLEERYLALLASSEGAGSGSGPAG